MNALLALLILAVALTACDSADDQAAETPGATAPQVSTTAQPTQASPSPTSAAECLPLLPDAGFPVMIGRQGDGACVIWRGPQPARIIVETGNRSEPTPASAHVIDDATSPFQFPTGVLPELEMARPCFRGEFRVRVESDTGQPIGGVGRYTCLEVVVLADGCSSWLGGGFGLSRTSDGTACILWPDRQPDETGFRIELSYPNSGEKFVYNVPANTVEFIPPAPDVEGVGTFANEFRRKDWGLFVWAITPAGEVLAESQAVTVQ